MLYKIFKVILATCLYSAGVALFLDPNNLAPGGVTGVSILLNRLIHVETGTLILLLNIPLLIIAWRKFGLRFVAGTLSSLVLISVFTNMFEKMEPITTDLLLAAVAGGICIAVGLGTVLKSGLTTGGTDIVVRLLRLKHPHLKTGSLFLIVDLIVISGSLLVFRDFEKAMYAVIAIMITSWVLDLVLYGKDEAKLIYIISDEPARIAKQLLEDLDVGVTYLEGTGAYTDKKKKIIMCVVRKRVAPKVEEVVKSIDSGAFMIVTSASEIFGQGYKSYFAERF
ncbi:MAG: YitT family protein [Lachnospiraceae bacterium]|nr:YitT family protein [Lachnospiraceae bacterium]